MVSILNFPGVSQLSVHPIAGEPSPLLLSLPPLPDPLLDSHGVLPPSQNVEGQQRTETIQSCCLYLPTSLSSRLHFFLSTVIVHHFPHKYYFAMVLILLSQYLVYMKIMITDRKRFHVCYLNCLPAVNWMPNWGRLERYLFYECAFSRVRLNDFFRFI